MGRFGWEQLQLGDAPAPAAPPILAQGNIGREAAHQLKH
jgi:hypothetical protein